MNGSRIKTWAEAIGLLAVVASLVFVGLEIRQNAAATRAATAQSLSDGWLEWNLAMATPDRWEVVARVQDLEDLSQAEYEDAQALRSLMRSIFQHWSNLHWQYQNGQLDQGLWEGVVRNMEGEASSPRWARLMRWAWESDAHIYHQDFQDLLNGVLAGGV